jgi:transcription elongation factor Elf1
MGGMNKKPESYYQCPHCGHWHLTSKLLNKTTAPVSVDVDDDE